MKPYQDLTDGEVLVECGAYGPARVGAYLFERAQHIRQFNPNGSFGPDRMAAETPFIPSPEAEADLAERGMLAPKPRSGKRSATKGA